MSSNPSSAAYSALSLRSCLVPFAAQHHHRDKPGLEKDEKKAEVTRTTMGNSSWAWA